MVRLTAELILSSPACINPLKERELDLRDLGNKIALIENLGATQDQYDVLDFSDNDIVKLGGFPALPRLTTILLNNNKVAFISDGLGSKIPNLTTLILTNTKIANLADLAPLAELKNLAFLSLLKTPVSKLPNYRAYLIHKIPTLKIIDFQKVKEQERKDAVVLFGGAEGAVLKDTIGKTKAAEPGKNTEGLTAEQKEKYRVALSSATTLEEINRLENLINKA